MNTRILFRTTLALTCILFGSVQNSYAKRFILELNIDEGNGVMTPTDVDDLGDTQLFMKTILSPDETEYNWHSNAAPGAVFSTPHPTVGMSYITIPDSLIQQIPGGEFRIVVNGISPNACQFSIKIDQNWIQGVPEDQLYGQAVEKVEADCKSNETFVLATQNDPDTTQDSEQPNSFNGASHNSSSRTHALIFAIQDMLDDLGIKPSDLCDDVDQQCQGGDECVPTSIGFRPKGGTATPSNASLKFVTGKEPDGEYAATIDGSVSNSSGGYSEVEFVATSCGCYPNIVEL